MSDAIAQNENVRPVIVRILAISVAAFLFLIWLLFFKMEIPFTDFSSRATSHRGQFTIIPHSISRHLVPRTVCSG